ncbi:MAG: NAD(P)-dependent oxidoreductase [Pyrinomonadaceae bacterium MAG19_C2-C3]|nr:NAD(P)-dependent oxidoreductase [Pyrinomonadaceae bacterium MAG19_C2-C3]
MKTVLVTGGSGFFGELLKKRLLEDGMKVVNIDLEEDHFSHPQLVSIKGDIRNTQTLEKIYAEHQFDCVFHCAAILAYAVKDHDFLWTSNVEGTRNIAEFTKKYKVPKLVFTSTCCLWAHNVERPVMETDEPNPVDIYGKSKWAAEKVLLEYAKDFDCIIIRTPTIIERGRLGLLAILFEFIDEGRKVWVVGGGSNRYQFVDAQDLIDACIKGMEYDGSEVFNVGSDNVKSFREVYNYVIKHANTGARVATLPRTSTLAMMRLAYKLGVSPLGPYQYKMIAENFMFDTTKIKQKMNWQATTTNEEMLLRAYEYYHENLKEIKGRKNVSAHKQPAKMGVIRLLKWMS